MFKFPPALLNFALAAPPAPLPVLDRGFYDAPFGTSRRTVAQDRRTAKKRRAKKRARKLGHA